MNCVDDWMLGNGGTPDYFNRCGFSAYTYTFSTGPPIRAVGDSGYVGFLEYTKNAVLNTSYKEYVGVCLLDTFHAGESYTVEIDVAYNFGLRVIPFGIFGNANCVNLPANSGTECPLYSTTGWVQLDTVVHNFITNNWYTVSFTFTPTIDVTTIIIGPTCTPHGPPPPTANPYSIYYMDNVVVKKAETEIISTGHYCTKDVVLSANVKSTKPVISYQWYRNGIALVGSTNSTYSVPPNTVGDYQVYVYLGLECNLSSKYSVDSTAIDFDVRSQGGCSSGGELGKIFVTNTINGDAPYKYGINGGILSLDSTFINLYPGGYLVRVEDSNCYTEKNVTIDTFYVPKANFESDIVCEGNTTTFSDKSTIFKGNIEEWKWEFPSVSSLQNPTYTFLPSGTYPVKLTVKSDSGCMGDTTINIFVNPTPIADFSFLPSQVFAFDTKVCFSNLSSGASNYFWDFDFTGVNGTSTLKDPCTVVFPEIPNDYSIKLMVNNSFGCLDSAEYSLVILEGLYIFIPSSFSPNADAVNDVYSISVQGVSKIEFTVFNRWGESIFQTEELDFTWDGKHKGEYVENGVYLYVFKYVTKGGQINEKKGHITVLR